MVNIMLISALAKGEIRVIGYHDKDDKPLKTIIFRPDAWAATTVYEKRYDFDVDAVMPTTYKGFYFEIFQPGKSGATDPFTGTYKDGDRIEDGTAIWVARNYNLMPIGVTVSTVDITVTDDVTVSGQVTDDTSCQFFIDPLPVDFAASYFDLTLHVTYSNGVERERTLRFMVNEQ